MACWRASGTLGAHGDHEDSCFFGRANPVMTKNDVLNYWAFFDVIDVEWGQIAAVHDSRLF